MFDQEKVSAVLRRIRTRDPGLGAALDSVIETRRAADTAEAVVLETTMFDEQEQLTLESIALAEGRPVLTIVDEKPKLTLTGDDRSLWFRRLTEAASVLKSSIPSVGRVQIAGHPRYSWVGTGWVVAPDILVTNRHVADEFAYRSDDSFVFDHAIGGGQMKAEVDYLVEQGGTNKRVQRIVEVLHIEAKNGPDIAFLRLDDVAEGTPIRLSEATPSVGDFVAIVGYPARDSRVPDTVLMERLFGGVYDCKRLAPGQIDHASSRSINHDCTTLGGNSGSALLSLATGEAVGLHYSGRFLDTNFAVPSLVILERLDSLSRPRNARPAHETGPARAASTPLNPASIQLTIPVTITISADVSTATQLTTGAASLAPMRPIGGSVQPSRPNSYAAAAVDGSDIVVENKAVAADYLDREGYDPAFLGDDIHVPLPAVEADASDVLYFDAGGDPAEYELRYEHFSVVMNNPRRLCFFSACNIDGTHRKKKVDRTGWRRDPRIAPSAQIRDECYGNAPKFAHGHMTRREDPIWGSPQSVKRGNSDSMHVTNAVPQMQTFNAGVWLHLEDYALDHARNDKMRICVFTGPFLRKSDPMKFGVKIPVEFWKVLAFTHDDTGELSATGYSISQLDALSDDEFVFGEFETYQRSIASIELDAGLSFGSLTATDRFSENESAHQTPLGSELDIQW